MPCYVSFLRGINVGGHRVTMDALRRHFAALKLANIDTFIASGNVLFDARAATNLSALEARIEKHLAAALGYEVPTFIRSLTEIAAVTAARPFADRDLNNAAWSRYVLFLRVPLSASVQREIAGLSAATDEFCVEGREIHWLCRGKISEPTPAAKAFEKVLRAARADGTLRNIKMLHRLLAQKSAGA